MKQNRKARAQSREVTLTLEVRVTFAFSEASLLETHSKMQ